MNLKKKIVGLTLMCLGMSACGFIPEDTTCQHVWGVWETIEDATCSKKGTKVRVCDLCGEERSKSIAVDPDAHKWVKDVTSDKQATCVQAGIQGSKKCQFCGEIKEGTITEKGDHQFIYMQPQPEGYVKETCVNEGKYSEKCTVCGQVEEKIAPKADHEIIAAEPVGAATPISCKNCDLSGYDFSITEAHGWNKTTKMNAQVAPDNTSTWSISKGQIPAGTYDVMLKAIMTTIHDGGRKFYNMSKTDLAKDAEMQKEDLEYNAEQAEPDKESEDDYRYTVKVNEKEYNPLQYENFETLGLGGEDRHSDQPKWIKFVDGVDINDETTSISLCHKKIGVSLVCSSIRLIPHVHDDTKEYGSVGNGKGTYELLKCRCGYRKLTIAATSGEFGDQSSSKEGTPNGFIKLNSNGNYITYSFVTKENIQGNLYMVGREDSYPGNKTQNPYNCGWYLNDDSIEFTNSNLTCGEIFGEEADASMPGYSKEGAAIVGEITLKKDRDNTIKYVRTGSYNMSIRQIVIEGKTVSHLHDYVRDTSKDIVAKCTEKGREAYVCSCGDIHYEETSAPIGHDYSEAVILVAPTCTTEGQMTLKCKRCGDFSPYVLPIDPVHTMQAVDAGGESYKLSRCAICGMTSAEWELKSGMIQDYVSESYIPSTTVMNKTGKMSDNVTAMSVFKFDKANRRAELSFYNDGSEAKEVTFKALVSARASDVGNCRVYKKAGTNTQRFSVTVNNEAVTLDSAKDNKTLADLGVKSTRISNISDNGALVDATWIDFCTFTVAPGRNTIYFEVAAEDEIPIYFGGFGLSYNS